MEIFRNYTSYKHSVEQKLQDILSDTALEQGLREGMSYAISAGGKRLRPCIVMAVGEAFGANREDLMTLACAIEMLHTASLIHDDLPDLDNDVLRRGRETNHVRYGVANAILHGDAMINFAHTVMLGGSGESYFKACKFLSERAGAQGMLGGQSLDVNKDKDLPRIHMLKTAAMFEAAFCVGAICAGADEQTVQKISELSLLIGMLFQVVDDVLDTGAGKIDLGKSVGKDEQSGKVTYCTVYGEKAARAYIEEIQQKIKAIVLPEIKDLTDDLVKYIVSVI